MNVHFTSHFIRRARFPSNSLFTPHHLQSVVQNGNKINGLCSPSAMFEAQQTNKTDHWNYQLAILQIRWGVGLGPSEKKYIILLVINAVLERGTTTLSCYLRPTLLDLRGVIVIVWKANTLLVIPVTWVYLVFACFLQRNELNEKISIWKRITRL